MKSIWNNCPKIATDNGTTVPETGQSNSDIQRAVTAK
jgi:hypothetical protein